MSELLFLSGNEAVAHAVRLSRPRVIAAYPITPQTVVVEKLADMVENGELETEFVHVESEHSALSLVMGSAAMGVRTFTATSSQGLLYMAEILPYTAGGRFPLVMMNANRALALPWNIYGDQSDSLSQISCGWIQSYAETAQESLDLTIQAYAIAEDPHIRTPVMVNLDGFVLTHTYEPVLVPDQQLVDEFLPAPDFPTGTPGTFNRQQPQSLAMTAGPGDYSVFKYRQHQDMLDAAERIRSINLRYARRFGAEPLGLTESYRVDDAEFIVITAGSIAGSVRCVVDELRDAGIRAGLLRLRYLRPFPTKEITHALFSSQRKLPVRALAVLEKDISFGHQGTISTEVKAALYDYASRHQKAPLPCINVVAGLGGQNVSLADIHDIFASLQPLATVPAAARNQPVVHFTGLEPHHENLD